MLYIAIAVGCVAAGGFLWYLDYMIFRSCKHEWKILSETKLESKAERYCRLRLRSPYGFSPRWIQKEFIQIMTCPKCGKIKRFVTKH